MNEEKISIFDVDFSVRTVNLLCNNNIEYLNELTDFTSRTLLQWRGIGKRSLDEIREKLTFHKLSLRDETIDEDIKKTILYDLPSVLKGIKQQIDEMQIELRFFSYKIEQVEKYTEKSKRKDERQ